MNLSLARVGGGVLLGAAIVVGALAYPHGPATSGPAPAAVAAAVQARDGQSMTWATLRINGNLVAGDSTRKGRENMIEVLAFNQAVVSPRDAQSGLPTGRRQYQPLLIRKRIDKASPLLMKALTENQVVELTVDVYQTAPTGVEQRLYEIHLQDARVSDIKIAQDGSAVPTEEVSFTFQKISWTHVPSNTSFADDQNK